MTDWINTDLSDLITRIDSGSRPSGGASEDSGEIPSLGGENIRQSGGIAFDTVKKVPLNFYNSMTKGVLQNEDVLINKDGANTGKVGIFENQFPIATINEHLFLLRGHPERLCQRYLYYILLSQGGQERIHAKIAGSAQPGLKRDFIKNFPVYVPVDIYEQSTIAKVLASIDLAIEQTEALIAKYQQIKTGLIQDLLTRGIDEDGRLRDPARHEFKPSPLGMIPADWEVTNLGNESKRITSGSRWWAKHYSESGALFIRIGNMTREHVNLRFDDIQYVDAPPGSEANRTRLETGDLLISITADLGIIGVIPNSLGEAYINQHIALVKLDREKVNPWWVGNFLAGPIAQKSFNRLNESGAKAGLNLPTIASLQVPKPKPKEQKQIAQIIQEIDETIAKEKQKFIKIHRIKSGLMQDLLTGKVSVAPLLSF